MEKNMRIVNLEKCTFYINNEVGKKGRKEEEIYINYTS